LQAYDGISDDEAKQRAGYDPRWKMALGIELDTRPFAKSTLLSLFATPLTSTNSSIPSSQSFVASDPFSARLLDCGPILCRAAPRTSSSSFRAVAR
jgi:hypothetical protein